MQAGHDTIIAVDGPTGPIYKVKPGALFMAKKTNAMIIPLAFSADPCIILKAWDRYLLPVPFAKAVLIYGKPFKPSSDLSDSVIQKESIKLEKILNNLMDKANRIVQFH